MAPTVLSLGCRLNLAEGEAMRRLAVNAGLEAAVVINSCAVTNEAVRETRQKIRRARRENPAATVIVTGCAAQIDPEAFAAMPEVDAVIGNDEKLKAESWARLSRGDGPRIAVNDIMAVRETAAHFIDGYGDRARAFLQVQNGCDHRCTFCIIPYGRGASRSSPVAEVIEGARRLVASGHKEIVLTGVDMTSWGADLPGAPKLGDLVRQTLDAVPDLFRLRLSSVDCAEIDETLFDCLTTDSRIAPYLHLSLQAGADLILKRMKRRHSRADAIALTTALRERRPDFAIGADFIAGFPTETEAHFEETLSLIDEAGVNFVHAFPFSPRSGAPAAKMPPAPGQVIAARARRLREKGAAATAAFLDAMVGRTEVAVVESGGRARLGNFAAVKLQEIAAAPGEVMTVRIVARDGEALMGAAPATIAHEKAAPGAMSTARL
ncbi:MAG: tRNA (N(6)-L-threonylcarbamoyladenosine(37)-C(2))-methylthiotransferase MtaB [Parvularculaceae bacterium]|nr:tRNA (N(6)-L-threonylcarbamoyladenosine(37)-C(2))-methylthiotransferase MtaB [Parvularculaceae bacterium]